MPYYDPTYRFPSLGDRWRIFTDCEAPYSSAGTGDWLSAALGTGAVVASGTNPWATNIVGTIQLQLGTTATGRAAFYANTATMRHGAGAARFAALMRIDTLSSAADTYSLRCGWLDAVSAESVDAICFRYTDAATGALWNTVTRSNGVETVTTATGVTVAVATAYKLLIEVNAAATQVLFYINGALVATHTANIPGTARDGVGLGIMALKSVGLTNTNAATVDFIEADQIFDTPRW